jgi:hypothetical protein
MSTTPDEQQRIDTEAEQLQDLLVQLMLETALRQKPFQDVITAMREVVKVAGAKDITKAPPWLGEGLKPLLKGQQAIGEELRQIKTRLTSLEDQVGAGATDGPSQNTGNRSPLDPIRRQARSASGASNGPMIAVITGIVGLLVGAALTAILSGNRSSAPPPAVGAHTSVSSSASLPPGTTAGSPGATPADPAHPGEQALPEIPAAWTSVWANGLSQAATCPGKAGKFVTFEQCACPEIKPPAAAAGGSGVQAAPSDARTCGFDEKDPKWSKEHLAIEGLQAVLLASGRLDPSKTVVDGGLGYMTAAAVKDLAKCAPLEEGMGQDLMSLERTSEETALTKANSAALKLLGLLKKNPSCLSVKPASPAPGQAPAAGRAGEHASSTHNSQSSKPHAGH